MARAKLFLDEDVHEGLGSALRRQGIDAITASEANRKGLSDVKQLEFAVSEGRALVTFNLVDYEQLAVQWFQRGFEHNGIIVSPQRSI